MREVQHHFFDLGARNAKVLRAMQIGLQFLLAPEYAIKGELNIGSKGKGREVCLTEWNVLPISTNPGATLQRLSFVRPFVTPASIMASISCSEYPTCASTSELCSPSVGGRR